MKKTLLMGAAICAVVVMSSCKSGESAYKKAYEKAKAQQEATTPATPVAVQPTTTPVAVTPAVPVTTTPAADYSNVAVRTENVSLVNGTPLKAYSVVVGSFSVQSNANALSTTLAGKGYTPRVVKAVVNGADWYRVIATSYDTKAEAAQSRAALEGQYSGAWLLYQK
ncbi:MAG: SPOR domain-containing protein [Bacteroidaceae bacterium]|nr:SPOR domain-containing protein [Bacteroidaceae bacterium]